MKKLGNLVSGFCLILIGFVFLVNKIDAMSRLTLFISIALFIKSIFLLLSFFKGNFEKQTLILIEIALDIITGIILLVNSNPKSTFIPIIMGIWITINGILQIINSIKLKNSSEKKWYIKSLVGILLFIAGILIIINPIGLVKFTALIIGIFLIFYGLFFLYNGLKKIPSKK